MKGYCLRKSILFFISTEEGGTKGEKWTQSKVGDMYIISEEEILTMRLNCVPPPQNLHVEALNPQHLRMELYLEIESLKR